MPTNQTPDSSGDLTISNLSERTGVPQPTLRTWEHRYGVPRPRRLPSGHRRYTEHDIALVDEILRQRTAGLSLETAVQQAVGRTAEPTPSVFAGLRRNHPALTPQAVSKRTLLALTRAIEDECAAQAERPVLFAAFQHERFFRQSEARWRDLGRTALAAVVFAEFARHSRRGTVPARVRIPDDAPLRREWLLVCDATDYPACVAGWEKPGQGRTPSSERIFETVWSADPRVVRDAARACAALALEFAPTHAVEIARHLGDTPPAASADLQRATGLLNRTVHYLELAR